MAADARPAAMSVVLEYITNMRALIDQQPHLFGMMVERQVQVRLLPKVSGTRQTLEPDLWALLVFCLDGHQAAVPELNDEVYQKAQAAATAGAALSGQGEAVYPRAAQAVFATLVVLREAGVYPAPRL